MRRPIALRLLRFRVAVVPVQFLLLAAALHGRLGEWRLAPAALALLASFVAATSLNDVWDERTDRANRLPAAGRPLLDGSATPRRLTATGFGAAAVALAAGAVAGPAVVAWIAISLLVDVAYSVPPLRLCSRPLLAVPALALAYAGIPIAAGLACLGVAPGGRDWVLAAASVLLMAGRLVLKDFRDVSGDAATGKRTFLLAYGKRATLAVSAAAALSGTALLAGLLASVSPLGAVATAGLLALALSGLREIAATPDPTRAAAWVAVGARTAQGAVLAAVAVLQLAAQAAPASDAALAAWAIAAAFATAWLRLRREASAQLPDSDDVALGVAEGRDHKLALRVGRGDDRAAV